MARGLGRFLRQNTIAMLALFIALTGTTYAASTALIGKNTVASPQVVNGSLQTKDLSAKARAALKGNRGPRGLAGAAGAKGDKGDTGATGTPGSAVAYAHVLADGTLDTANSKNIVAEEHSPSNVGRYCFQLNFTPKNAIATSQKISFEANSIVMQVGLEPGAITGICPAPYQSASVYAWTSNTAALADSAFFIVFE